MNNESIATKQSIDSLRNADFKIAVQKKGELTQMTLDHFSWALKQHEFSHCKPDSRTLFSTIETCLGIVAVIFVRNIDLGMLVETGAVDASVVGTDMIEELNLENIQKIRRLSDGSWNFVFASPNDKIIVPQQAKHVATSLPRVAQRCFNQLGNKNVLIRSVAGSVEIMPYLEMEGCSIDGVADICVSGKTMRANNLTVHTPELTTFHPVLIAGKTTEKSKRKQEFLDIL